MASQRQQTGIVQSQGPVSDANRLTLQVSHSVPIPCMNSPKDVLVRVLTVALNPTDFKMVKYFPAPDSKLPIGCDFCGIVEGGSESALASFPRGTRVTGSVFPYGTTISGAFAEWLVADAAQLLKVPDGLDDFQGAAIGGICWGTSVIALFADSEALNLPGSLTNPSEKRYPVLVYGGATATGTMACQMLKL